MNNIVFQLSTLTDLLKSRDILDSAISEANKSVHNNIKYLQTELHTEHSSLCKVKAIEDRQILEYFADSNPAIDVVMEYGDVSRYPISISFSKDVNFFIQSTSKGFMVDKYIGDKFKEQRNGTLWLTRLANNKLKFVSDELAIEPYYFKTLENAIKFIERCLARFKKLVESSYKKNVSHSLVIEVNDSLYDSVIKLVDTHFKCAGAVFNKSAKYSEEFSKILLKYAENLDFYELKYDLLHLDNKLTLVLRDYEDKLEISFDSTRLSVKYSSPSKERSIESYYDAVTLNRL